MSKHARRVATLLRHRKQVARLIAIATEPGVEHLHCAACGGTGEGDNGTDEDGVADYPEDCDVCGGSGSGRDVLALAILNGLHFDVALAREYGRQLVAEGQRSEAAWGIFKDWTIASGKGPSARAFVKCRSCCERPVRAAPALEGSSIAEMIEAHYAEMVRQNYADAGEVERLGGTIIRVGTPAPVDNPWSHLCPRCDQTGVERGGWPGDLSAAWAQGPGRVRCSGCNGRGKRIPPGMPETLFNPWSFDLAGGGRATVTPGLPDCSACGGSGQVEGPRPQPGDAKVRMGKSLLAALEGQSSECPKRCRPSGVFVGGVEIRQAAPEFVEGILGRNVGGLFVCVTCSGTGHNLAGVLPPIDWMKQHALRRKLADMPTTSGRSGDWLALLLEAAGKPLLDTVGVPLTTVNGRTRDTREVPRGQHRRHGINAEPGVNVGSVRARMGTLDQRITARRWSGRMLFDADDDEWVACLEPSWVRGERRHAAQRNKRAGPRERRLVWNYVDAQAHQWALVRFDGETDESLRARILGLVRYNGSDSIHDLARAAMAVSGVLWAVAEDASTDPEIPPWTVRVTYTGAAEPDEVHAVVDAAPRRAGLALEVRQGDVIRGELGVA